MSAPSLPPGVASLDRLTQPKAPRLPLTGTGNGDHTDLKAAAQKFETMAIAQLLKPMFATMGKASPPFGGGAVERSFKPFLIDTIAREMEARGGFGLAPMIETALSAERASTAGKNESSGKPTSAPLPHTTGKA